MIPVKPTKSKSLFITEKCVGEGDECREELLASNVFEEEVRINQVGAAYVPKFLGSGGTLLGIFGDGSVELTTSTDWDANTLPVMSEEDQKSLYDGKPIGLTCKPIITRAVCPGDVLTLSVNNVEVKSYDIDGHMAITGAVFFQMKSALGCEHLMAGGLIDGDYDYSEPPPMATHELVNELPGRQ